MKEKFLMAMAAVTLASAAAYGEEIVRFDTRDTGTKKPIQHWGIDATWASKENAQESVRNAGPLIDFVRIGVYMNEKLGEDGSLSVGQIGNLRHALDCAEIAGKQIPIMISPHNEAGIIDWYKNPGGSANLDRWFQVMEKTKVWIEAQGHKVIIVEAFNEPDFGRWKMGNQKDLNALCERLKVWQILRVGPSTMTSHAAEAWYEKSEQNLDAGSTHTLYGRMKEFQDFVSKVKRDRKKFIAPEAHSIAEAMAAAEAEVDYVAWWAAISPARGSFMRACQGTRLAYTAVEENWSTASVYRAPDGTLHGFADATERENGKTTAYTFLCSNDDVTYYPNGNREKAQFRKSGEGFVVHAKPPSGERLEWVEIVPKNSAGPR